MSRKDGWIHTLRNSSFAVIGPKLFNSIPNELRELPDTSKTVEANIRDFKINLDKYLSTIPDIPGRPNSLLDHGGIDYGYKFVECKQSSKAAQSSKSSKTAKPVKPRTKAHSSHLSTSNLNRPFVSRWDPEN